MFPVKLFVRQVLKHLQELDQSLETEPYETASKLNEIFMEFLFAQQSFC